MQVQIVKVAHVNSEGQFDSVPQEWRGRNGSDMEIAFVPGSSIIVIKDQSNRTYAVYGAGAWCAWIERVEVADTSSAGDGQ